MRPETPESENAGTMAPLQKFMFDRSFDPEREVTEKEPEGVEEEPEEEIVMFTEEQILFPNKGQLPAERRTEIALL